MATLKDGEGKVDVLFHGAITTLFSGMRKTMQNLTKRSVTWPRRQVTMS
jgi:hypothetical protein